MTTNDTTGFVVEAAAIPCPTCHEARVDVLRPDVGMLEFRCSGCGHQWLLFDRSPQDESER